MAPPKRPSDEEIRRPLLSVADALDFAGEQLQRMASEQRLVALIHGIMKEKDELKTLPESVRTAMVEPERQEKALAQAARLIRELATEHRVLDMRELDRLRSQETRK